MVLGQVIMRHKLHLMKVIFLDEILPLHPECMWAMPKVSGKQMSITNTGQFRDNMRPLHHTGEEECSICKTINSETGRPTAVAASRRLVSSTIFTNLPKEDQVQKNETLCATQFLLPSGALAIILSQCRRLFRCIQIKDGHKL